MNCNLGSRKKTSTSHALFTLKTTVDHFLSHGSNVYVAYLDCTKAFDRISHFGLFSKLMKRQLPLCILMCLIHWYLNMSCRVKWGTELSREFTVPLGIKQGGINSPDFFGVYLDDLSKLFSQLEIGCNMFGLFLALLMFADDIVLMAPTRMALNKLIQTCSEYCTEFGLSFNSKKS